MKLIYTAQIIDEDEEVVLVKLFSYSREGLEEEMGKRKWTGAEEVYKNYLKAQEDLVVGNGSEKNPF